ncbi:MAG: hypothetical protein NTW10_12140 [Bacteroidetes bacterium]|nr:hypothetical protein [Bacteroidota bacterium]
MRHNLKTFTRGKVNIKFYGTSRIESGISPVDVERGITSKTGNTHASVQNCGMSAEVVGWGMKMQELYYATADVMVIEIHPGKNPMTGGTHGQIHKEFIVNMIDQYISFHLNHVFVLHYMANLLSELREKLVVKNMYTYLNGWTSVEYVEDPYRLNLVKKKVSQWAEEDLNKIDYMYGWDDLAKEIRTLQQRSGCRLIFIRMPVDGLLRDQNQVFLANFDCMQFLSNEFPSAQVIDATTDPVLGNFHKSEDSHLSAEVASRFSFELGRQLQLEGILPHHE